MNLSPHLYPHYPKRVIHFYGLQAFMPLNAAFEGEAIQGSGCGFGQDALQGAMGEFIERRHFFTEIPTDKIGKIHDYNTPAVAEKFYAAINQIKAVTSDPANFDFQLVKVHNLFDQSPAYIPKRMVSLGKITHEDEKYIPLMDSSGIAVHGSLKLSLQSSLHEFIERQALVGSWLSQCAISQYQPKVLFEIPSLKRLAEELTAQGNLSIFDISTHLSGYTIMICYFSKSAKDKVQYVIGVATAKTLLAALEAAFSELWQDYLYIYCYTIYDKTNSDDFLLYAGDTYHMNHFQDNTLATREKIPYYQRALDKIISTNQAKAFSHEQLLANLKDISPFIYLYENKDATESLYYTRVLSPDFYLHMSIDKPLNFNNLYAQTLQIGEVPANRERIPFP